MGNYSMLLALPLLTFMEDRYLCFNALIYQVAWKSTFNFRPSRPTDKLTCPNIVDDRPDVAQIAGSAVFHHNYRCIPLIGLYHCSGLQDLS
jgi:hypothetical protein